MAVRPLPVRPDAARHPRQRKPHAQSRLQCPLHLFIGFTVSGFFAGIAGALYAMFNNFVSPSTVALAQSVEGVLMMIAGGVGTLFGGFVGAAAIIALENVVSAYTERWQMVLGVTFILIMIFAPEGIIGSAARYRRASGANRMLPRKDVEMDRRQFLKTSTAALTAAGRLRAPWRTRVRASGDDQNRPARSADRRGRLGRQGDGRGRAVLPRSSRRARSPAARSNW